MGTATDPPQPSELVEVEDEHEPPALLERPQPLGFLPSWWFWNDPKNWALIKIPFAIFGVAVVVIVDLLNLPLWATPLAIAGVLVLALGLIERYIRHAAKRRFRPRPEPPALGQEREDNP